MSFNLDRQAEAGARPSADFRTGLGRLGARALGMPSSRASTASQRSPDATSLRRFALDVVLVTGAVAIGLPSLYEPFGRDQAVFFYVAREWLSGRIPYRDTFDAKPPAIHLLHVVSIALFGEVPWGIRVFDLVAVVVLGFAVARVATRAYRVGAIGAAAFVTSLIYYGFFDFWNTAQCEIWCATLGMVAIAVAMRGRRVLPSAMVSGVVLGLAFLFKPTALVLAPVLIWELSRRCLWPERRATLHRRWRSLGLPLAAFVASISVPSIACLFYFYAKGGLAPMIEILVENNAYYVAHGALVHGPWEIAQKWRYAFDVFGPVLVCPVVILSLDAALACCRRDAPRMGRALLPIATILLSVVAVTVQQKFYWYHWGVVVGPLALSLLSSGRILMRRWSSLRWPAVGPLGCAFATAILFACSGSTALKADTNLWGVTTAGLERLLGRLSAQDYDARFEFTSGFSYSVPVSEQIGHWLRENASADDEVAMRGHEPLVYAISGKHYSGRFFWTSFLTQQGWASEARREKWLEEDRLAFVNAPPRFVVVTRLQENGPDSAIFYESHCYRARIRFGDWIILEGPSSRSHARECMPRFACASADETKK